jgi:hypothetical protein
LKSKSRKLPRSAKTRVESAPRLAIASLERVLSALSRARKKAAPPVTAQELADRERMLRRPLPPSYRVVVQRSAGVSDRTELLDAASMAQRRQLIDDAALVPFAEGPEHELYCFDRKAEVRRGRGGEEGELPVYVWRRGQTRQAAPTFAHWLDEVADRLEDRIASASDVPPGLRALLVELGFSFEDPIVGRLETGDVAAVEELIGSELAREVRGKHQRLFDSSGKASLALNLDEFSLAVSLRTGIYMFSAEEVFRWLRYFRDEGFFGEAKAPSHPDRVRDLRRAPREPPLVLRGVLTVSTLPSGKHTFRAASGRSPRDFYLLGRTARTEHASSVLLHVVSGNVQSAHAIDEPLSDLHVDDSGAIWGLVPAGSAIRFQAGAVRAFPLRRASRGRAWFYGITTAAGRVVAYGAGALLQFDGTSFVPFQPDPKMEPNESVVALASSGASSRELAMLVVGEQVGAVAHFDGRKWAPITESDVIDGSPIFVDVFRQTAIVLCKDGSLHRAEPGGTPRPVIWDMTQEAFRTEAGGARPLHEVRATDGGALVASDGGVVVVGGDSRGSGRAAGEPVFYAAPGSTDPVRLSRVGGGVGSDAAVVVMCGSNVWLWENGAMTVLDLRAW